MKKNSSRLLIQSTIYFLTALLLFGVTTYAWFIITDTNITRLISQITEVEAEYEFYRFNDSWHDGNPNPKLLEQRCNLGLTDQCYQIILNPSQVFNLDVNVSPGERFSFAIKIIPVGSEAYLNLDLGRIQSLYYHGNEMRIQDAFYYEITKVSYIVNGIESDDLKDQAPIQHFNGHFTGDQNTIYPLIHHVPIEGNTSSSAVVVIYFDFYYDPQIKGIDSFGLPYPNQNHLANQAIIIEDIYMMIHPSLN